MGIVYQVKLTAEERKRLEQMVHFGRSEARGNMRARILLKCDESEGRKWTSDANIGEGLQTSIETIKRTRKRLVEEGLEKALNPTQYRDRPEFRKLDGKAEAHLIALCCDKPPKGRARWTLNLLADQLVTLERGPRVSRETIRRTLKKMHLSPGKRGSGAWARIRETRRILPAEWRTF